MVDIEIYPIYPKIYSTYFIYIYFIFYFSQKYFNILKNGIKIEKLAISWLIISNKSMITWKKSLMTITPNIRPNQVINWIYNIESLSIKVLIIIQI